MAVHQINHAEVGIVAVWDDNLYVQFSVRVVEIRAVATPPTSSNMQMMLMMMTIKLITVVKKTVKMRMIKYIENIY